MNSDSNSITPNQNQNNNTFKELFRGLGGGLVGYSVCHPFDTIKTRIQNAPDYNLIADLRQNGPRTLFRGMPSPLLSVVIEKGILFSAYDWIKFRTPNQNSFVHGFGAGILTTLSVTPFERIKVRSQISNQPVLNILPEIIRTDGLASLYRGWSATLFREVPGYTIYFSVFEMVKARNPNGLNPMKAFATGALCGISAWLVIYPSDPIKTVMQNKNVGVNQAIREIWKREGLISFYRGIGPALIRSGLLHGIVIMTYDALGSFV